MSPIDSITRNGIALAERLTSKWARRTGFSSLDDQELATPSDQTAVDIFKGRWACALPPPCESIQAGPIPSFEDKRVQWGLAKLGPLSDKDVLELGPLEAGHTFLLSRANARSITAVESNKQAYLKCLVVKELVGLPNARFVCGDCLHFMADSPRRYDLCFASGILYHMENPARLIERIAKVSDRMFLWTHYHSDAMREHKRFRNRDFEGVKSVHDGFAHRLFRQWYGRSLLGKTFWGGTENFSNWMPREDILRCLSHYGFNDVEIGPEETMGPNGPSITLIATRR